MVNLFSDYEFVYSIKRTAPVNFCILFICLSARFATIDTLKKRDDSSDEEGQRYYAGGSERGTSVVIDLSVLLFKS